MIQGQLGVLLKKRWNSGKVKASAKFSKKLLPMHATTPVISKENFGQFWGG